MSDFNVQELTDVKTQDVSRREHEPFRIMRSVDSSKVHEVVNRYAKRQINMRVFEQLLAGVFE